MTGVSASRDQAADFERLARPEVERLYRLAVAVLGDPGDAEDIVQETLWIAWRRWPALGGYAQPGAWLSRVCLRQCLRHRRRLRGRVLWSHERWGAEPSAGAAEPDARFLDLERSLTVLSARQRAVLLLHFQDGLTVDECAAHLGCRPGTARSHLGRAVAKLRRELDHG